VIEHGHLGIGFRVELAVDVDGEWHGKGGRACQRIR
jgi:hypothetical protein